MREESVAIPVDGGAVPAAVLRPEASAPVPALVVIPSIFGPAPDLLRRLGEFGDALVVVPDPFWRVGAGVVEYADREKAFARMKEFEPRRCAADLAAVVDWSAQQANGKVIGVGICFGGPWVLRFAAEGKLGGVVTWHGSRMEQFLENADRIRCPLRLHFGDVDPVTPPEAIEAIRTAFLSHPDVSIVVHPGATHGFSHDGDAYDESACGAGLRAVRELLEHVAA